MATNNNNHKNAQSDQKHQTWAGQRKLSNESNAGQRALIEAYMAIRDLRWETSASAWIAWIRLGRRTAVCGTFIKKARP